MAWFADLLLLVALFASASLALAWGEFGSFRLPGDKSALAGLAGVLVFMVIRWSALAVALAVGVARGGWPGGVDSGTRSQVFVTLLAHLVLGIVSYQGFEWVVRGIQADDGGPQRAAWLFAIVLPLPAFMGGSRGNSSRIHPSPSGSADRRAGRITCGSPRRLAGGIPFVNHDLAPCRAGRRRFETLDWTATVPDAADSSK